MKTLWNEESSLPIRLRMMKDIALTERELLELTRHTDKQMQHQALQQLSRIPDSATIAVRAAEIFHSNGAPTLRLDALDLLYRHNPSHELLQEAWNVPDVHDSFKQFAMRKWASDANNARERFLDLLKSPPSEPVRVLAIELLGRIKDKTGERRVFDALAAVLKENSFGARATAIGALRNYGDKGAIPLIEPLTKHPLYQLRSNAIGAVAALKGS